MRRTVRLVAMVFTLTAGLGAQPNAPSPTFADIDYAPPDPATSKGHKLDLYLPAGARTPMPVVIWTAGSAWMSDTGKGRADVIATAGDPPLMIFDQYLRP